VSIYAYQAAAKHPAVSLLIRRVYVSKDLPTGWLLYVVMFLVPYVILHFVDTFCSRFISRIKCFSCIGVVGLLTIEDDILGVVSKHTVGQSCLISKIGMRYFIYIIIRLLG